jgi:demethylmenaquinone methyltransferase/2-methoxy-6-polyprenyl-1,4-benzoquinol methylase
MKMLEGRPRFYDKAMDKVSKGHVLAVKKEVARELEGAKYILDIGCGTGELAQILISQGSVVHGFDINASMIEVAEGKIKKENLQDNLSVSQMGVDGMDSLQEATYDAVVSTLVFSEFSDDERTYAFRHSARILKPGGIIVIADEVIPKNLIQRLIHKIIRLPMLVVTYLIASSTTTPVADLSGEMRNAGFTIEKETFSRGGSFAVVIGKWLRNN